MTCYASINFKTKKAFKEAVASGQKIRVRSLEPQGESIVEAGVEAVSGPWYPQPHKWYAQATVVDGYVTKVT